MIARTPRLVAGSAYALVIVVLAAWAAWPIYADASYLLLVGVAAVLGAGIAAVTMLRAWGGWATSGLLVAAVLLVGVPLAVPGRLGGPAQIAQGLIDVVTGVVTGWKDLLTVELPVGDYRNLLVPALVVFLCGTCAVVRFAWRGDSRSIIAVPAAVGMIMFGLGFGNGAVSDTFTWGAVSLAAPRETVIGVAAFVSTIAWLTWRSRAERQAALRRAAPEGARRRIVARRVGVGAITVAAATAVAVAVVPNATADTDRAVLRESTSPVVDLSQEVSPLTSYRAMFANTTVDDVLFTVQGAALPDRIRIATLDSYDGTVFRTSSDDATQGLFERVPSARDAGKGVRTDIDVTLGSWSALWMPTAGAVVSAQFEGARAATLADGFYYNDDLDAAVQTQEWARGDRYVLRAVTNGGEGLALSEADAPGGVDTAHTPPALRAWVEAEARSDSEVGAGAELARLVTLLRERSYLSHALMDDPDAQWLARIPGYRFASSAAGHSVGRLDEIFLDLATGPSDTSSVVAIGDDEQFAAAVALIARELGFPSRVVVGARLSSDDPTLTTCREGSCRGGDIAAWVEVLSGQGTWIPVDVTPQFAVTPDVELVEQQDPRIGTEVRPDQVEEVAPPLPAQQDDDTAPEPDETADLGPLWAILRTIGIAALALAIVLAPVITIVIVKAVRRRRRRHRGQPADQIAGGWDELTDAARDARRPLAAAATRSEIAQAWGGEGVQVLAQRADAAVFSHLPLSEEEAAQYWQLVETERARWKHGLWQRVRSAVSLRSFLRARTAATPRHEPRVTSTKEHSMTRGGALALGGPKTERGSGRRRRRRDTRR